jgi:hypothetical protein
MVMLRELEHLSSVVSIPFNSAAAMAKSLIACRSCRDGITWSGSIARAPKYWTVLGPFPKLSLRCDLMSAFGTRQTLPPCRTLSAFAGKADYGTLDDPQSQPPAGTSVAAQNVNVPFVWSIFQIAGYGAALWWAKGESAAGPGGIAPTLFTALEHSIESKLIGIS